MSELIEKSALQSSKPIRVLLVDDQSIVGASVREMLSECKDMDFFFCQDPKNALDAAEKTDPTVILQDLVMPDVDGLTLVKFFRASPRTRDIPIIVLSSKEEAHTKSRAFEFGANDYMVKFPDRLEVLARIRYHSRAYTNFRERNLALKKLQESQAALKKELEEAENYVESLLPPKFDDSVMRTDWVFKSSTALGGDCFGYMLIARGCAHLMLDARLEVWDLVPLIPVMKGAGICFSDWDGADNLGKRGCVAACTKALHDYAIKSLNEGAA